MAPVIVHVHIPKMAGTTVMRAFPRWAGISYCPWQSVRWPLHPTYGNETYFYELLTRSCAAGAAPACFSSYEGAWDDALAACRRQPDARPIMLTLLRSPMAWLYSAMRWSGQPPEKLARAGSWRTADGYGFDRPLCALSGRTWCRHPGLVDPGRSRAELVEHILRNLAQRDTAPGLRQRIHRLGPVRKLEPVVGRCSIGVGPGRAAARLVAAYPAPGRPPGESEKVLRLLGGGGGGGGHEAQEVRRQHLLPRQLRRAAMARRPHADVSGGVLAGGGPFPHASARGNDGRLRERRAALAVCHRL
mmetsp:Transcript_43503/g.141102  ORF Transcript_43503/g.141102 Transcript_43503/m.141102 type:complete len:303 (-) Transcript_43503:131-1039(-)